MTCGSVANVRAESLALNLLISCDGVIMRRVFMFFLSFFLLLGCCYFYVVTWLL
jgi:hypothetical protein